MENCSENSDKTSNMMKEKKLNEVAVHLKDNVAIDLQPNYKNLQLDNLKQTSTTLPGSKSFTVLRSHTLKEEMENVSAQERLKNLPKRNIIIKTNLFCIDTEPSTIENSSAENKNNTANDHLKTINIIKPIEESKENSETSEQELINNQYPYRSDVITRQTAKRNATEMDDNSLEHKSSNIIVLRSANEWKPGPTQCKKKCDITSTTDSPEEDKHFLRKISSFSQCHCQAQTTHSSGECPSNTVGPSIPFSKELEMVAWQFPTPKCALHNCYVLVAQEFQDSSYNLKSRFKMENHIDGEMEWKCTYEIKWPEEMFFSSIRRNKMMASKEAALKALHWLQTHRRITKTGAPIIKDWDQVNQSKIPIEINIDQSLIEDIETILQLYKSDIEPLLSDRIDRETENNKMTNDELLHNSNKIVDPISNGYIKTKSTMALEKRNEELYRCYMQRRANATKLKSNILKNAGELPIAKLQSQIVELVGNNRVVIVKGEPGCGKSTQVPQYVFDDWTKRKCGAECNIIVTQPRRISAISLAERIAYERQECVGDVVGFQVRFKEVLPCSEAGFMLICSTGILLRRLQNNLSLVGLSHVILDEAHERDINTDILLVLLRRALALNPQLHLVVMSATINTELFNHYLHDAPALHVLGFTHPVKSYYLADLNLNERIVLPNGPNPIIDCKQVVQLIHWIDKNRPPGAILCFLPGWAEIKTSLLLLKESTKETTHIILPLHSKLSYRDQRHIFNVPPSGVRKVILATNIAETSITIDDVVYVVDTGTHKEIRYNLEMCMLSLDTQWISRASVSQRKGRAGRVKPGESFYMFTEARHNCLDEFPIPEIMRIPLEKTILDCKTFSPNEKAAKFLAEMPEPPSSKAVNQAVTDLIQLGALDKGENLTPLGRRIAHFSIHPKLSKALIHAAVFRCLGPIITITTVLSSDMELFLGALEGRAQNRESKCRFHPLSDHLAIAWLYQHWEMIKEDDAANATHFCDKMNISEESLELVSKLRKLYSKYLKQSRLLNNSEDFGNLQSSCNRYSENDELLKAVLLSGLDKLFVRRNCYTNKGHTKKASVVFTESGHRAEIHSVSVNFKREDYPSPFITCFRQMCSQERGSIFLHDTTLLSPLAVLLFSSGELQVHKYKQFSNINISNNLMVLSLKDRKNTVMVCEENLAHLLVELRQAIWFIVDYFVAVEGYSYDNYYSTIMNFHEHLLDMLSVLLYKAGAAIDYKDGKLRR